MKRELLIQLLCHHYGVGRKEFDNLTDKKTEKECHMIRKKLSDDY